MRLADGDVKGKHYSSLVFVLSRQGGRLMVDPKPKDQKPQPGVAMQKALEARGAQISVDEAARLSAALLSFVQQGLIVPAKLRSKTQRPLASDFIREIQIRIEKPTQYLPRE